MKFSPSCFYALLIFCFFASNLCAQQSQKDNSPDICEIIGVKLEVAGDSFKQITDKESYLIIIGNRAKGEKEIYNQNRMKDAVKYLILLYKFDQNRIVYGIGKKLENSGSLQLFVNGKLESKIYFGKKGKLCFGMGETFSSND